MATVLLVHLSPRSASASASVTLDQSFQRTFISHFISLRNTCIFSSTFSFPCYFSPACTAASSIHLLHFAAGPNQLYSLAYSSIFARKKNYITSQPSLVAFLILLGLFLSLSMPIECLFVCLCVSFSSHSPFCSALHLHCFFGYILPFLASHFICSLLLFVILHSNTFFPLSTSRYIHLNRAFCLAIFPVISCQFPPVT